MNDRAATKTAKSESTPTQAPAPPNIGGPVIQVKSLRLASAGTMIVGRQTQDEFLEAGAVAGGKHYALDYIPGMRHHRITLTMRNSEPIVEYLHESHVRTWRPA